MNPRIEGGFRAQVAQLEQTYQKVVKKIDQVVSALAQNIMSKITAAFDPSAQSIKKGIVAKQQGKERPDQKIQEKFLAVNGAGKTAKKLEKPIKKETTLDSFQIEKRIAELDSSWEHASGLKENVGKIEKFRQKIEEAKAKNPKNAEQLNKQLEGAQAKLDQWNTFSEGHRDARIARDKRKEIALERGKTFAQTEFDRLVSELPIEEIHSP